MKAVTGTAGSRQAALITGGRRGIGRATALLAAREGYDVGVNYVGDEAAAEATAAACRDEGVESVAIKADVADPKAVTVMFEVIDHAFGRLDLLVNNAGIVGKASTIEALDDATLRQTFEVNVFASIYCAKEAIKRMSRQHAGEGGVAASWGWDRLRRANLDLGGYAVSCRV